MKKNHLLWVALVVTIFSYGQTIFINEFHYTNTGVDINEGIEIAGPAGTDISGYEIRLYNGNGTVYSPIINLSGTIPNQQNNLGTLWFDVPPGNEIQNGSPDGFALVDNLNNVIQFLSYEGVITAVNGPAVGLTSVDIGIFEANSTPVNYSLQLIGTGSVYSDFSWNGPILNTRGSPNTGQTLPVEENNIEEFRMFPNPVVNSELYIHSLNNEVKLVKIYTLSGKQVYKETLNHNEVVKLNSLVSGIYLIKIEENGKIESRKLIIK